jgi:hypothetical protein
MSRALFPASLALALTLACLPTSAQPLADVPPPPRLETAPAAARTASAPVLASTQAAAPAFARAPARAASAVPSNTRVIEDDEVRIEESRGQRGQLQRITVRNKAPGARSYEIIVGPAGQDPSQPRGAAGQRAWSLFDF